MVFTSPLQMKKYMAILAFHILIGNLKVFFFVGLVAMHFLIKKCQAQAIPAI